MTKNKQQNLITKNDRKLFFINNLDAHYNIELFGKIKIQIKNKQKFDYKEVDEYGLTTEKREPQLIVSLTTFPERISTVAITINTLLQQTIKPDKLILWLADSQFPNKENDLPQKLLKLKDFGLEIRWCEDLGSYKKLVPTLTEFPNDIIITADDDLYYQQDWLESLYSEYLKNPNYIYTRRACKIKLIKDCLLIGSHYANYDYKPSFNNKLLGGSGTLFPPHKLHKDILNIEQIKTLIPTQDDIYFWAMAVLNGTKIKLIKNKDKNLFTVENTQESGLCKINKASSNGSSPLEALKKIIDKYPKILEVLNEEQNA